MSPPAVPPGGAVRASPAKDTLGARLPSTPWSTVPASTATRQRSPFHRDVLVGTSYRDISDERLATGVGIPAGFAWSRLHYALNALRRQLTECDK
jgi:DNA-directed RNA polymerase specialized sigma24 family protein